MSLIFLQFTRQGILVAKHRVIDKRNTCNPVTFRHFTIALQVILTTREVPHKVPPIHEIHLIAEEETQVLAKRRTIVRFLLAAVLITHTATLDICPALIAGNMVRLTRIHAREQHLELAHILIRRLISRQSITVFLALYFRSRSILRMTLFFHRNAHVSLHFQLHRRIVCLAVQQRTIAILLTIQIILQTEHVIRRVLIHRRIGIGTNHQHRITRVTDNNHRHHQKSCIQPAPEVVLSFAFSVLRFCPLKRINQAPNQQSAKQHQTYCQARIERTSEHIHKQQFKPSDKCRKTRNKAIQNHRQNHYTNKERVYRTFPRKLVTTEVINHHNRRYSQQVQQVYANTQTHQIGNQYQPTVTSFFICLFVPFQNQPEHHSRKQRRRSIYLTFYRRKPESVRKCIGQSTYCTGTQNGDILPQRISIFFRFHRNFCSQFASQSSYRPEQEKNRKCTR